MNYLLTLQTLIAAIKAVEQLMPGRKGKEKFDAALALVEAVVGDVTPIIPALQSIATLVVTGLRATGIFAQKAA